MIDYSRVGNLENTQVLVFTSMRFLANHIAQISDLSQNLDVSIFEKSNLGSVSKNPLI